MPEYPIYPANNLNDILMRVPTDKLAVCMRDMTAGLLQAAEMRDQFAAVSEAMGVPFDQESFVNSIPWTWVDDGQCLVKTSLRASHAGETVTVTREVDHLATTSEPAPTGGTAELFGELYQVLGALGAKDAVLDQVLAAAEGRPLPHATLLPYAAQPDEVPGLTDTAGSERLVVRRALLGEIMTCIEGTGWRCADDLRALLSKEASHV